ncbi:MAG: TIGR04063 family PEP-CTERM/XrtA system glycosyltransferase [Nitrospirota bacterium]
MKILHVLDHSLPYISGYSIRSNYIVECEKKIGITPSVITSPKHITNSDAEEIINGITYYRTMFSENKLDRFGNKIPFIREFLLMKCLRKRMFNLLKNNSFDIIHAHSPSLCGIPALLVAKKYKIPIIYEIRALWEEAAIESGRFRKNSFKYQISKFIEKNLFQKVDVITTICQGLKDNLIQRGIKEDKIFVIPNCVDTSKFVPQQKDKELIEKYQLQDKIVLGFIGSFYKFEGLEYLIRAVPNILKEYKDIKILLIGEGEDKESLKEITQRIGVKDNIFFIGKISHDQILKYYSIIDILVYPRINTPLTNIVTGLKLLEAMSMEKVVVASDVGGNKELIKDKITGILFKAEDVEDLSTKLITIIKDTGLRNQLGKSARNDMISNRDWDKTVLKYKDIYIQSLKV